MDDYDELTESMSQATVRGTMVGYAAARPKLNPKIQIAERDELNVKRMFYI